MKEREKLNYKRVNRKHQTIWNFMRRNPIFRINDLNMICDISNSYLKKYISYLSIAGYLRLSEEGKRPYSNRIYILIRNSGIKAPKVNAVGLYDENTKDIYIISNGKKDKELRHLWLEH